MSNLDLGIFEVPRGRHRVAQEIVEALSWVKQGPLPVVTKKTDPGQTVEHIFIPDTQAKAGVPLDHLAWIGQYIVEEFHDKPVKIIHIGDHADMPSLSSYDKGKKSMEGRRYVLDIAAANEAWAVLNNALVAYNYKRKNPWWPERHITLGNHEDRISKASELDAQLEGLVTLDALDYERSGWQVHPFLEPVVLDGIAYAHYWQNQMNSRPMGGTALNRLKNLGHSFSMGHQQTLDYAIRFVKGRSQHGLIAGACYLHEEAYRGPQGEAHWRGIVVKHEVRDGSYDPMFISLDYLCRRYEGVPLIRFMKKKYPKLEAA